MVIGRSTPRGVDTRPVMLRPWRNWFFMVAALVALLIGWATVSSSGDSGLASLWEWLGPPVVFFWLFRWRRIGVRVQATGLIERSLFSSREIRWDEIDSVRLEQMRVAARSSLNWYGPVLALRSGETMPLRELRDQSTERHAPRSLPARHVAVIASYLNDSRSQGRG